MKRTQPTSSIDPILGSTDQSQIKRDNIEIDANIIITSTYVPLLGIIGITVHIRGLIDKTKINIQSFYVYIVGFDNNILTAQRNLISQLLYALSPRRNISD